MGAFGCGALIHTFIQNRGVDGASAAIAFFHKIGAMRFNLDLLSDFELTPERESEILKAMRKIYPDATEQELREGKETLENYLKLGLKIIARMEREARNVQSPGQDFK